MYYIQNKKEFFKIIKLVKEARDKFGDSMLENLMWIELNCAKNPVYKGQGWQCSITKKD